MGHNRVPNKESEGFLWDTSARPKLNRTQHLEKIKRSNQLIDLLMVFFPSNDLESNVCYGRCMLMLRMSA